MIAGLIELYRRHIKPDVGYWTCVLTLFMTFNTTAYASYHIPSQSMLPTLEVGDRIFVSKFAYGYSRYSLPVALSPAFPGKDGRLFETMPQRGDVVVFKHPPPARDDDQTADRPAGRHIEDRRMAASILNGVLSPNAATIEAALP